MTELFDICDEISDDPKPRVVVRLKTEQYATERGLFEKKCLYYLRRRSEGFNFVREDADSIGGETVSMIDNLHDVEDGVYEIIMVNLDYDPETGYLDSWDYHLIPYKH